MGRPELEHEIAICLDEPTLNIGGLVSKVVVTTSDDFIWSTMLLKEYAISKIPEIRTELSALIRQTKKLGAFEPVGMSLSSSVAQSAKQNPEIGQALIDLYLKAVKIATSTTNVVRES